MTIKLKHTNVSYSILSELHCLIFIVIVIMVSQQYIKTVTEFLFNLHPHICSHPSYLSFYPSSAFSFLIFDIFLLSLTHRDPEW